MKFTLYAVCLIAAVTVASASDAGHFIPKSFYKLDSDGHKSNVHPVNPHAADYLRRLRRQTSSSSSSSSSSVSSNGGPVYFSSQQVVHQTPAVDFSSRFGGSSAPLPSGHVVQTVGVLDQYGQVRYQTQQGHF